MPRYMWSADWETGEPELDRQHRALFELMEKVTDTLMAGKPLAEADRALAQLRGLLETHFREEEAHMAQSGYPGLSAHASLHREMLEQVKVLLAAYHRDPEGTPIALMNFLATWHLKHIAQGDKAFAGFLKAAE